MNARSLLLLLACSLPPATFAAQLDSASVRQVLAAEDQRFAAMVHVDTGALKQLLADDLTYTHTDGKQDTKVQLLQSLSTGALRYESIAPEAREVRVVGSVAVVTGRSAMRVGSAGRVHVFRIRYLAIYNHGARGWQLVAWQATRLPA